MERSNLLQGLNQFCSKYDSQTYLGSYRDTERSSLLKEGLSTRANSLWKMAEYVVAYKAEGDDNDISMLPKYIQGWRQLASKFANQYLLLEISNGTWRMYDSQGKELGDENFIINYIKTYASQKQTHKSIGSKQLIYFGAPGTGKSYQLKKDAEKLFKQENIERVTFYPNYSYAQFVGTYKPISDGNNISYAYVPGPFMRQWIRAKQNSNVPFLLIVEELNRANAPAVFGDMFQLLDRKNGISEYSVTASEDLRMYLKSILSSEMKAKENQASWEWLPMGTKINSIELPDNLYIWATMNSADQGVFPLDTAFKRRWDNRYIGINDNQAVIAECNFHFSDGIYNWNEFRKGINSLLTSCRVNEDKLIGPFFLNPIGLSDKQFTDNFKSKVLMYLFEDAARQCRGSVFAENANRTQRTYSELCAAFDELGVGIFKGVNLTSVSPEEDESFNDEEKSELKNFIQYLSNKKNLVENTRKGYASSVSTVFKLLKGKSVPIPKAIEDNSIVFAAIDETYENEGTRTNYYTGWRTFVEFKKDNSTGTQE